MNIINNTNTFTSNSTKPAVSDRLTFTIGTTSRKRAFEDVRREPPAKKQRTHRKIVPNPIIGLPLCLEKQIDALEYQEHLNAHLVQSKLSKAWARCNSPPLKNPNTTKFQYYCDFFSKNLNLKFSCDEMGKWKSALLKISPEFEITPSLQVPKVGFASTIGRRSTMEDAHLAQEFSFAVNKKQIKAIVTGIFDGHGGSLTALHAQQNLCSHLKERLEEYNLDKLTDVGIWNAIKIACVDVSRTSTCGDSGSTATFCVRIGQILWVANVGDSRTLLVTKEGKTIALSEDGSLYLDHYAKRVEKRGASLLFDEHNQPQIVQNIADTEEIFPTVNNSGSLGEQCLGCSARPKIIKLVAPEKSILIHCCDGVTDVANSTQIGDVAHSRRSQQSEDIAAAIALTAYTAGSTDNISVAVCKL